MVEIVPLACDIAERESDLDACTAKLRQPPPSPDEAVGPVSPDQPYFVFLHSLHAIAAKNGIAIPQISYRLAEPDKGSTMRRYFIETTFTTRYEQFRGFIFELRTLPGIRCEKLSVSQPNIAETKVEVRLQCAFLVEAAP